MRRDRIGVEIEVTDCPECGDHAQVQPWTTDASTHGAIEHVRTLCFAGHLYLLPRDMLVTSPLVGSWRKRQRSAGSSTKTGISRSVFA